MGVSSETVWQSYGWNVRNQFRSDKPGSTVKVMKAPTYLVERVTRGLCARSQMRKFWFWNSSRWFPVADSMSSSLTRFNCRWFRSLVLNLGRWLCVIGRWFFFLGRWFFFLGRWFVVADSWCLIRPSGRWFAFSSGGQHTLHLRSTYLAAGPKFTSIR